MTPERLAEIRGYLDEIYAPGRLGDLYAIELMDHVDQLTAERDTARRLALPAFTSPEGDLSEHTHVLDSCDGPKGHDYKQVNTFRVNGGPMYQTFRCDPCGGRYTSPVAGPTIAAPEPNGTITATLPDWYLNGEAPPDRPSAYDMPVGSVVVTEERTYTRDSTEDQGVLPWRAWDGFFAEDWIEGLFSDGLVTEWRLP